MTNQVDSTRSYRKRRRAEQEAETRQRITEAAVKLHGTIGPAKTTVSGIAKEAGVQRATVYRHFPDEGAIYEACTSHYNQLHPLPDPTAWEGISDQEERLRVALGEIYDYYAETHSMLESINRDIDRVPALAEAAGPMVQYLEAVRSILIKGSPKRGRARQESAAAIGHAIGFPTWSSLVEQQGLSNEQAVEMMARLAAEG